ncbi:MAG: monovalent cation/H+ antiporter subunit D family protein [Alphaproteobacteria bacterium]|nr:monovalent cation/H+ antiporter subunit D family protein [Alphaproteobacteria bacterium]
MISPELALPLAVVVPLIGFFAIWALDKHPNLREGATILTGVILLILTISVFEAVAGGARPSVFAFDVIVGLPIAFSAEPLGALFGVVASGLWLVNSFYSIGYMRGAGEKNQTRFYMAFAVAISSAMGVAYAQNLFTLFIFYEILTLSTVPLVTHKGDDAARRSGRIYLGVLLGTSIGLFLPAIVWTYAIAGSSDFVPGGLLARHVDQAGPVAGVLLALYAFGVGKAALMPVHPWLPNAMVAPTPVSAFLHAVAVVKAGVFAILKISVYIFGVDFLATTGAGKPILYVAGASIILASAIAMKKDNLKARLAYSTVSQLSYVTMGAMLASSMGVAGGAFQIAAHALAKITLFMCAGAIYVGAHKNNVSEMRGLGRVMPVTFGAFTIAALSIVGLPPLAGSWPKFLLMIGAADAGERWAIAVLVLSSILNVVYLLGVPAQAFYLAPAPTGVKSRGAGPEPIDWGAVKEAPLLCVLPPVLTAAGALLLFFFADPLFCFLAPLAGGG